MAEMICDIQQGASIEVWAGSPDSVDATPLMPQNTLSQWDAGGDRRSPRWFRAHGLEPATGETALRYFDSAAHHRTFPLFRRPLRSAMSDLLQTKRGRQCTSPMSTLSEVRL